MELIQKFIKKIRRHHQKKRLEKLVRLLPADMQTDVLHKLLCIIDIPDRIKKITLTREIFKPYKDKLEPHFVQKIKECIDESNAMLVKVQVNVIAPTVPITHIEVNHAVLDQKVKAKLTLDALEEEIVTIPKSNRLLLISACFGILVSGIANFMTFSKILGNDWMGGNELYSTIANFLFSLLLLIFEAIGFYILFHYMSRKVGHGFARIIGIIGALLLIASVCTIIISRGEIGSNAASTTQDIGKVE